MPPTTYAQDITEYTGAEQFVANCIKHEDLQWVPTGKAICMLGDEDAEEYMEVGDVVELKIEGLKMFMTEQMLKLKDDLTLAQVQIRQVGGQVATVLEGQKQQAYKQEQLEAQQRAMSPMPLQQRAMSPVRFVPAGDGGSGGSGGAGGNRGRVQFTESSPSQFDDDLERSREEKRLLEQAIGDSDEDAGRQDTDPPPTPPPEEKEEEEEEEEEDEDEDEDEEEEEE
jgi:hypothetical protein